MRLLFSCAVALTWCCASAHADDATWNAPPECGSAEAFAEALERDGFPEAVELDVHVTARDSVFVGTVRLTNAGRELDRSLEGASCGDVLTALREVLLILVSSLDTARAAPEAEAATVSLPADVEPPSAPTTTTEERLEEATAAARSSWHLGGAGQLDVGALGGAAFGLSVHGGLRHDAWNAELSVLWLPSRTLDAERAEANLGLVAVGIRGGYVFTYGALDAEPFAFVEAGVAYGKSEGFSGSQGGAAAWAAIGAGARIAWRSSSTVRLFAEGSLVVPLAPVEFSLGVERASTASPLCGRVALGVDITFE